MEQIINLLEMKRKKTNQYRWKERRKLDQQQSQTIKRKNKKQ